MVGKSDFGGSLVHVKSNLFLAFRSTLKAVIFCASLCCKSVSAPFGGGFIQLVASLQASRLANLVRTSTLLPLRSPGMTVWLLINRPMPVSRQPNSFIVLGTSQPVPIFLNQFEEMLFTSRSRSWVRRGLD